MAIWHTQTVSEVTEALAVDTASGLTAEEAGRRLVAHGPNELVARGAKSAWAILRDQLTELMVLLLVGAALVSGAVLGEWQDAGVIFVIVILNTLLGFRQEYKAEQAMEALKKMSVPVVRVRRGGETVEIDARSLVPGDVLQLEAGALVPADCRLLEAAQLQVRESALTGEAEAVHKNTGPLDDSGAALGDRRNMVYRGTVITYGRGTGLVVATGMETELGRIAGLIESAEEERTVLQKRLDHLSKVLVGTALALIAVVAVEGWLIQKLAFRDIFLTAVSMAVAAIPEGLPAVVTIALALGAQRMLRRNALIRRLPAVETLGSVTVICSDKTGTLTQNRMVVTLARLPDAHLELPASGESLTGRMASVVKEHPAAGLLVAAGSLCADAEIKVKGGGDFSTIGDPTEGALVAAAHWSGWPKEDLSSWLPRVHEAPFDSDRKRMTTVHALPSSPDSLPAPLAVATAWASAENGTRLAFCKGAPDSVLQVCNRIFRDGAAEPLTDEWRDTLSQQNEVLAADGIRVLALAMRAMPETDGGADALETEMVYLGLLGMLDPLRDEVRDAVRVCAEAGIRPVMITGDHPLIARHIGKDLGLRSGEEYLTGRDLADMERAELERRVPEVSVYARVAPEHKLRIVDALQKNGHIVAMTGDGVNDAPALKEADIGVAMGITGTDVSKEAADMVLRDDNFATIVAAVEEGRVIFDNIVRFVRYILSSNWAEVLVMLIAPLLKMPLALLPVQILWMNLVTDGLPALALGVEPGEPDVMRRPPRDPRAPVIDLGMGAHVLWVGGLMAVLALIAGYVMYDGSAAAAAGVPHAGGHGTGAGPSVWQTMIFTTLVFSQLTLALAERSSRESILRVGLITNRYMVGALALTFALQLAVVYVPVLQRFFTTTALSGAQLLACLGLAVLVSLAVEVEKALRRFRKNEAEYSEKGSA